MDEPFQNDNQDDDCDGTKTLHQIIRNTVALHLSGLADEMARGLPADKPEDGVEGKNTTGHKSALDLIDKVVVPRYIGPAAPGCLKARLGSVLVPVVDHSTKSLKDACNNHAL